MKNKRYKKETIDIKIIKIVGIIFFFIFIIGYSFSNSTKAIDETQNLNNNPLIGKWESETKTSDSMTFIFDEGTLQINNRDKKLSYKIYGDTVIAKHTVYGIPTDITPPIKFKIINEKTIETLDGAKIKYKKSNK